MKTFPTADSSMSLFGDVGSFHDFPRLARESGFTFNLYRGRVDWNKIGAIDVDRLIRERDLEILQDAILSIMSCSLDSEYDLKVLDPNFVKLFRLAQLSVDYLQYCRRYLDHCVTVIQDQLRVALLEIEQLKKGQQQKNEEIKQLQKKLKRKNTSSSIPTSSPVHVFKCASCNKIFVSEVYLFAHQKRRHPDVSGSPVNIPSREIENLQQQVQELQQRLISNEEILKRYQTLQAPADIGINTGLRASHKEVISDETNRIEVALQAGYDDSGSLTSTKKHISLDKQDAQVQTSEDVCSNFMESLEKVKADYQSDRISLLVCVQQQSEEIKALREQLLVQHEAHDTALQKKLEDLCHQHQTDLAELRSSLFNPSSGSGDYSAVTSKFHQNTSKKLKAWEGQANTKGVEHDKVNSMLSLNEKNPTLESRMSSSALIPTKNSTENTNLKIVSHANEEKQSDVASTTASQDSLYLEKDSSPSSSSSDAVSSDAPDGIKSKFHESNEVRSIEKHDHDPTGSRSGRNSSKVEIQTIQEYSQPTSSASSESVSESGTSTYDSDSHSTPVEMGSSDGKVQGNFPTDRELENLSSSELNPHLLEGLKEDLQRVMDRRLRELGVDPEWDQLPAASFRSNMATVKHHQNIAARTHKSYFKIRDAIIREVDKRVSQKTKQQPSLDSSEKEKSQSNSSFSLLSKLKSSVKNKLSPSGRPSLLFRKGKSSKNTKGFSSDKTVENVYSSEPLNSISVKPDPGHEYETLSTKCDDSASSTSDKMGLRSELEKSTHSSSAHELDLRKAGSSGTSVLSDTRSIDLSPSAKQPTSISGKSFSRSMYANLDRSEMTFENLDSQSSDEARQQQPKSPHTSTPIKQASSAEKSYQGTKPLPSLIPSDIESISELESEVNDIAIIGQGHQVVLPSSQPRVSRSTAELLADVARFRQGSSQKTTVRPIFKSNLKSSVSAGNILKKKVVFRDEKAGFNTIELGPVGSSVTPQRSYSDSDLSVSVSTEPEAPVPLPRLSLPEFSSIRKPIGAVALKQNTTRDQQDVRFRNETITSRNISQSLESASAEKHSSTESSNLSHVSDIVKDIERKLEQSKKRPLFEGSGASTALPTTSPTPDREMKAKGDYSNSMLSSAGPTKDKSSLDDLISELLLDDVSSS